MFIILLSVLLFTSVQCAPAPNNSTAPPWTNLKDDQSLQRFRSTLLNQTLLPFLNDCFPAKSVALREMVTCSRYYDGILQLNNTDYVVQEAEVQKVLNESMAYQGFCLKNHSIPSMKYYQASKRNFSNMELCGFLCTQMGEDLNIVARPICVFLSWMGEQLNKANHASAVGGGAVGSIKPIASIKDVGAVNIHEGVKTVDSNSAKPDPLNPAGDLKDTQARPPILQPTASSNKPKINAPSGPAPIIPVDKPVVSAPPAVPVLPVESDTKVETAPGTKDEPNPPADRAEDSPSPTENHDNPDEQAPLLKNEINPEKHDSPQIDQQANDDQFNLNESDDDMSEDANPDENDGDNVFEVNQDKLKPKETPIVNPEDTEISQKSQEIIEGNYLSNSKHVTDPFLEESGSNFFTYFLIAMFLCIALYVIYHNKSKILALLLEGRRSDKGRGRRKHTAAYRKLDSNLEEAITSSASGRTTQIIY